MLNMEAIKAATKAAEDAAAKAAKIEKSSEGKTFALTFPSTYEGLSALKADLQAVIGLGVALGFFKKPGRRGAFSPETVEKILRKGMEAFAEGWTASTPTPNPKPKNKKGGKE